MVEEKDYKVTLIFRLSTVVSFAPMERTEPITKADAVENAIESLPLLVNEIDGKAYPLMWFAEQEGFSVAYPIDSEVEEIT